MNSAWLLILGALLFLTGTVQAQQEIGIVPAENLQPLNLLEQEVAEEKKEKADEKAAQQNLKAKGPEAVAPPEKIQPDSHWGAAFGTAWSHDYPSADQGRMRYLVMPTYKGKHFTIDRQDGVRGQLVDDSILKLSFSFIFLFPTKAKDMPVREGMPDLDWTFQLGPELQLYIHRSYFHTMYVRMPFRFIATTDFRHDFEYRDWNFAPGIRNVFYLGKGKGEITTRFDIDWASERYNDLFFQVDPKYATPNRPAYNARAGFLEYIVGINYAYYDSFPWTYFVGTNVYLVNNSINRESPLFRKNTSYNIFGGIIRYF